MSDSPSIPPEYRTLIALIRCAVHRSPPDGDLLTAADWPATLRLARQHSVDTYLYPWLAEHLPGLFSSRANVPADSAPAAWRSLFLEALSRTLLRQRQLGELFRAFERTHIDVIPLKGAWLSETVYDDPAQRSMSDLDLLVRESDGDQCHALFLSLGYGIRKDSRHNSYAHDQAYYHPSYPCFVELHWDFASETEDSLKRPDIASIWQATQPNSCLGHPVRSLSNEDQLAHLVQHLLHHQFATPLRGYVDVAIVLVRFGKLMPHAALRPVAERWQIGTAIPFVANLVAHLFDIPLPPSCRLLDDRQKTSQINNLLQILFCLPPSDLFGGESTLLRYRQASSPRQLLLLARRFFMPQAYLSLRYACARHWQGLPLAWILRAKDLWMLRRNRMRMLVSHGISTDRHLADFQTRESLVRQLLSENEKSG